MLLPKNLAKCALVGEPVILLNGMFCAQEEMWIPYVRLGVAPKDIANNFGAKKPC